MKNTMNSIKELLNEEYPEIKTYYESKDNISEYNLLIGTIFCLVHNQDQEVPVVEQTEPETASYTMAGTLIPKLRSKCCSSEVTEEDNWPGYYCCTKCNHNCFVKIVSEKE